MSGENVYKVLVRKCPSCGARIPLDAGGNYVCQYCDTTLTLVGSQKSSQPALGSEASESSSATVKARQHPDIEYERRTDLTEGAFSVLIPRNWQTKGGVERSNAVSWLGVWSPKSAANIDFTVMNDAQATVAIRWLPDMVYIDMQISSSGMIVGALYPPGSKYSGLTVSPVLPAEHFLTQILFPVVHSQAQQINVIEQRPLPMIAQDYQQRMTAANPGGTSTYEAGMITVAYEEKGVHFKETIFSIIENTGRAGDGKWGNKETLLMRAPANTYNEWLSTFSSIQQSMELNSQWLSGEVKSGLKMGIVMMNKAQVQMYVQSLIQNHQATKTAINAELFNGTV